MKTNNKIKEIEKMSLAQLIAEIDNRFKTKKQKYSQITWSLIRWNNGYWSVKVYDDWHKWMDKNIKEQTNQYYFPEFACREFLKWVIKNKINLKELQSK